MVAKFAGQVQGSLSTFYDSVTSARQFLEKQGIDVGTTQDIVSFVLYVQDVNAKNAAWSETMDTFIACESLLQRQRFSFPKNWLYMECMQGEWVILSVVVLKGVF